MLLTDYMVSSSNGTIYNLNLGEEFLRRIDADTIDLVCAM